MFKTFLGLLVAIILVGSFLSWSQHRTVPVPGATTTPTASTPIEPPPDSDTTITIGLGQTGTRQEIAITPLELISDSRCPNDVQCVWAGKAEVRVSLKSATNESVRVFEIGMATTTGGVTVTLVDALPYPVAGTPIVPSAYRFIFNVTK